MDPSPGDTTDSAIPEKQPLLIRTIITRILDFLPLSEIKRVRLICRQWNTETEPLLRKRAKILFSPNFQPPDFLEYYSDSPASTLPFTAFNFTNYSDGYKTGYLVSDLDEFFNKYGKNIKYLDSGVQTNSGADQNNRHPEGKALDIKHWIELLPDNMDKLTIHVMDPRSTNLQFNLENLARVKVNSLLLSECDIIVNSSNINRIAPSEISLKCLQFLHESEKKLSDIIVTDFVDFSKCSNIHLSQGRYTAMNFDVSKDIVNAKKVDFFHIKVLNSRLSKMQTDFLHVCETPSEAIEIRMKKLDIRYCSSMNLTHLAQTIETLKISSSELVSDVTEPLNLPNLKYLHFDRSPAGGGRETALCVKKFLSWFKNCSNLVKLHLESLGVKLEFDVAWLPKSIKRIKLSKSYDIVLAGDGPPIDVDVLLLGETIVGSAVEMLLEKIKPKVLVKKVGFSTDSRWLGKEKVEDFISFVRKNTQLEKIVINTLYGLGDFSSSDKTSFLQFAGEESQCYEFNNQIAKAISKEEFRKYWYYYRNYLGAEEFSFSYDCFV